MARIYDVSILTTKHDNGYCLSFTSRKEAEEAVKQAKADGCYHVRLTVS